MKKVLIPTKLDLVAKGLLTDNGNYIVVQDDSVELVELAKQNPDAYAIIVRSEKVTPEIIDLLPNLKVVIHALVRAITQSTRNTLALKALML